VNPATLSRQKFIRKKNKDKEKLSSNTLTISEVSLLTGKSLKQLRDKPS